MQLKTFSYNSISYYLYAVAQIYFYNTYILPFKCYVKIIVKEILVSSIFNTELSFTPETSTKTNLQNYDYVQSIALQLHIIEWKKIFQVPVANIWQWLCYLFCSMSMYISDSK